MKLLVLTRHGNLGSSSRLRFFQYFPYLQEQGIKCIKQPLISDEMLTKRYQQGHYKLTTVTHAYVRRVMKMIQRTRFDLVWIEKEALPWLPALLELPLLKGVPYVLDYDDAVWHNYDSRTPSWARNLFRNRFSGLIQGARLVICGNQYLSKYACNVGASWVEILPTAVDLNRYGPVVKDSREDIVPRIVWIGSPSTVAHNRLIVEPLQYLSKSVKFKMRLIGAKIELPGVDIEYLPWTEATEVSALQACDIGIMPLPDLPWERGKCGYKLIQYMACGLPVVASPVGVNKSILRGGKYGLLAETRQDWVDALESLLMSPDLRLRMGLSGRNCIENEYCTQKIEPILAGLLKTSLNGGTV